MEERVIKSMKLYVQNVENKCRILLDGINNQEGIKLITKQDFFRYRNKGYINEFCYDGIEYNLHGNGCTAVSNSGILHWDFGYRSRWCGIDVWKMLQSKEYNQPNGFENYSGDEIILICEKMVKERKMMKIGNQYYITENKKEKYSPVFPTDYDTIVIEYRDESWSIPRSKLIDKFIRKSREISKKISAYEDNYIISFWHEGCEVFKVEYNDMDYPESAVCIMTDQIIKNLS